MERSGTQRDAADPLQAVADPVAAALAAALALRRSGADPTVAGRSKWARIEALFRNRAFATEYADSRDRWRTGVTAVFPSGTYWLHRFASVPVVET